MGVKARQKVKGKEKPWWVFISHQGKRTLRKVGDKAAAEAVQPGEFQFEEETEEKDPTFGKYADSWIKTTVPATCKSSTLRDYTAILNHHIIPGCYRRSERLP